VLGKFRSLILSYNHVYDLRDCQLVSENYGTFFFLTVRGETFVIKDSMRENNAEEKIIFYVAY